jgi:outer membrane protein with beta-barrel domain
MQGKERNSEMFDDQFIDQAWAKMSGKLDLEMPVLNAPSSDKKVRYSVLLLFLFIGFVSGIATMFFIQKEKPQDLEKPTNLKYNPKEVAQTTFDGEQEYGNNSIAETDQLAVVNMGSKEIEKKIQNNFSNKLVEKEDQNSQTIYSQLNYNKSSSKNVSNQNADLSNAKPNKVLGSYSNTTTKIQANNISNINSISTSNNIQNKVVDVLDGEAFQNEMLSILPNKKIAFLELPLHAVQLSYQLIPEPPKLSFGFYLGTQTRDFDGLHGLTSGLYASYRLDSKFSIRSGIGYSFIKGFHLGTQGIADPLTPAFFEPIEIVDLQTYSTVSSLESNQELPIQSLSYIDLPIALDYRMNSDFGILMGVKFSYLIDSKTNGYFSDNLTSDEAALLDKALYESMKKMDFGTVLGLGFYPTTKVGLELKYNHGLVDYTVDEKWHVRQLNTNKTFELSLNYFLR